MAECCFRPLSWWRGFEGGVSPSPFGKFLNIWGSLVQFGVPIFIVLQNLPFYRVNKHGVFFLVLWEEGRTMLWPTTFLTGGLSPLSHPLRFQCLCSVYLHTYRTGGVYVPLYNLSVSIIRCLLVFKKGRLAKYFSMIPHTGVTENARVIPLCSNISMFWQT